MDKDTRGAIDRATQRIRTLLEDDFASQIEGTFDVLRNGVIAPEGGLHLAPHELSQREKIIAAIEHKRAAGLTAPDSVLDYLRDAAFTTVNRFVALKMLEARELVQQCISKGEQSSGYREFCGLAPGVTLLPESNGYRIYIESLFDELSTEVKVLFERRDPASVLWPRRPTFDALLEVLNASELASVWGEDETIGWVYQFFNSSDERRRMREESQAPRNSRELAVRNQFFTPRYVVEFLVDNTLGRTWIEMQGDATSLTERCRYFVRSGEEQTQGRPRKDPRDLRVLDPACGSGHFLLYCFDLLLAMYEEAWGVGESGPRSHATGRTLQSDYPDLSNLRRVIPALIIEHNLYGVDIDPRAAQIAPLALWLRAQRAWKDARVPPTDRPAVQRTHIVVAEPMPGDTVLVDEFAARLKSPLLRGLFRKMVSEMKLAGELGALLPVEEGIASELRRAREQFVKQRQSTGFLPGMEPVRTQEELDLSGIDDDSFFHEAEATIVEALRHFAETVVGSSSVRRRLFAGDTAQGIALIDLLRTRFDVVLMNPPFGAASLGAKKEFEKAYPRTKNDIFAAFVERGVQLLQADGFLGAITSRTGFFLPSFQKWRENILLGECIPVVVADLGIGVMDAALVEAAAYCVQKISGKDRRQSIFLRVLEELYDKRAALLATIEHPEGAMGRQRFEIDSTKFDAIPRSPFAYWVSDDLRVLFTSLPLFENESRTAKVGIQTSDDFRFVRAWWAVPPGDINTTWFLFAKGGVYSPFYADVFLVLNWEREGRQISNFYLPGSDRLASRPQNIEYFHRAGLTWPHRTKSELSFRALPAGCAFGHKGPGAFTQGDDPVDLLALLAICRSKVFRSFVEFQLAAADAKPGGAARSYDVGVIQRTPIPVVPQDDKNILASLARRAWSLKRGLDTASETSHAFTQPGLLQVVGESLHPCIGAWEEHVASAWAKLSAIQSTIDELCFAHYGIGEADRRTITEGFGPLGAVGVSLDTVDDDEEDDDGGDSASREVSADAANLTAALVSWAVGVAIGRFDVRVAMEKRTIPVDPNPFDRLPTCSLGILTGDDNLPVPRAPTGYPIAFPESGVLVDDPGHLLDLTTAVHGVFDAVFGDYADRWWSDVAALLDPKGHDLRSWIAGNFFEYHLKRYSKSRRKAPIFWQLGTPSGTYGLWLYAQRLTRDSFFQLQNEVVGPKLIHEERQLTNLIRTAGGNPSASQRKDITAQEAVVDELRAMLDEVKKIAPLWKPHLDDGVVLTMAPLWRLVPQHKGWQKELKNRWDDLVAGMYEWAHLAMHLWPERVVPKCATDRSLAIAHGLEDVFWFEDSDQEWHVRETPTIAIDQIVRERTSSAVKAALTNLLDAPVAAPSKGRTRIAAAQ